MAIITGGDRGKKGRGDVTTFGFLAHFSLIFEISKRRRRRREWNNNRKRERWAADNDVSGMEGKRERERETSGWERQRKRMRQRPQGHTSPNLSKWADGQQQQQPHAPCDGIDICQYIERASHSGSAKFGEATREKSAHLYHNQFRFLMERLIWQKQVYRFIIKINFICTRM